MDHEQFSDSVSIARRAIDRVAPKVAILHDWRTIRGEAEECLEMIVSAFPDADVITLFDRFPRASRNYIDGRRIGTTLLHRLPLIQHYYRKLLPLLTLAIEQIDLSSYDVVISNSKILAKGVTTSHTQIHICYCHSATPFVPKNASHQGEGVGRLPSMGGLVAAYFLRRLRMWDYFTSQQVDQFVVSSRHLARQVAKYYRRDAKVIYPGIDTERLVIGGARYSSYLCDAAVTPHDQLRAIIQAFVGMPDRRLRVIGGPRTLDGLMEHAPGNISLICNPTPHERVENLQRARAFLFTSDGSSGIAAFEAQCCGTPVLALGRGGGEIAIDRMTGLHSAEQDAQAVAAIITRFERIESDFIPELIRQHAVGLSIARFQHEFVNLVSELWTHHLSENSGMSHDEQVTECVRHGRWKLRLISK